MNDDQGIGRCKARFVTVYPRHHQPLTLADYERAAQVFMRDYERVRASMDFTLGALREQEARAQALMRVAPLPYSGS
ncbi:hypothetical protein OKW45_001989 [Paraburkholderia sp. WSM4175]|uniref:hypothetical protein n=1 Tax=Paraburkholderia sp. WSM4175 TaxID=2991072 RepID=UPI003D248B61